MSTANSTPTGLPKTDLSFPSLQNSGFYGQTPAPVSPQIQTPVPAPQTPAYTSGQPNFAPVTQPQIAQTVPSYSPQTGPSTQKVADAAYQDKLLSSFTGNIPSTDVTSGTNFSTAGAKRNTYESLLQSYLDQQKEFQNKYIAANTPTQAETDLQKQLTAQKTQAALNQEQALASGETSSFAGGEAQRVARTDAIKQAGIAAQLEQVQNERTNAVKSLEFLINSGDKSFQTQLEIRKLQDTVNGIDKQSQDTFFNLAQSNPGVDVTYDPTKSAIENLTTIRQKIGATQASTKSYQADQEVSALYNRGLITGGTETERMARANQIASLPPEQKKQAIEALARSALNTTQQGSYQSNQIASSIADQALSLLDSDLVSNPYKYTANNYVTYLGGKKDPKYSQFMQFVQSVNAPIRQGFFGASLTTGEQNAANQFLPNPATDDIKTLAIKLNNVKSIADFTNDVMIYNQVGGTRPKLDDYIKLDKNGKPKQTANTSTNYAAQDAQALKTINPATGKNFTQKEIDEYKQQRGFNTVGSGTNSATSQNLTSDFGSMQGLLQPERPVELTGDTFSGMSGLLRSTPQLQMKVEIPRSSKLSFVNNNPANLRFAGQVGADKGEGGFAKFNSPQEGVNALIDQIKLDAGRGHTLSSFINKFAPPTENDTKLYVQQAVKSLGYNADTPIKNIPVDKLTKFMVLKESSTKLN